MQRPLVLMFSAIAGATTLSNAQQSSYEMKTELICVPQEPTQPIAGEMLDINNHCSRRFCVVDDKNGDPLPF